MLHQLTKTSASTGDTTFSYDGDGARLIKTFGAGPIIYHYDNAGRLLSERDKSGNFLCDYVYLHGKLAVKIDSSGAYFYHNDPAGTPLS
jgi:YD repeat-containing protein